MTRPYRLAATKNKRAVEGCWETASAAVQKGTENKTWLTVISWGDAAGQRKKGELD
jgi:hypothetical protein